MHVKVPRWLNRIIPQAISRADAAEARRTGRGFDIGDEFTDPEYGKYYLTSALVYAAVRTRAEAIGLITPQVFTINGSRRSIAAPSNPVVQLLHRPNPAMSGTEFFRLIETYLCLYGTGYIAIEPPERSRIPPRANRMDLWPLKPDNMRVIPGENTSEPYIKGYRYYPTGAAVGSGVVNYLPEEIEHLAWPNPLEARVGASPIAAARRAIEMSMAAMKRNEALFRGAVPDVVFLGDEEITEADATQFYQRWEQRYGDGRNATRPALANRVRSVEQIGFNNRDMEYQSTLKYVVQEVGRVFGVPSVLLNDFEGATLANVREYERAFWRNTIQPEANFLEDRFNNFLLPKLGYPNHEIEFNFNRVAVWGDSEEIRVIREANLIDRGVVTINEARRERNLEDVSWGNIPRFRWTNTPLEVDNPDSSVDNQDPSRG